MKVIGITGGVGSGKSLALSYMKNIEGVIVYEADKIAREEQANGTECFRKIIAHFGSEILAANRNIDRKKLGELVFCDKKKLKVLNEIVHPAVQHKVKELIHSHELNHVKVFVLEAAILIEGGYQEICDEIWYVYTDSISRLNRLKDSRGYSEETFEYVCGNQMSEDEFRACSDFLIDNSGSIEQLHKNIDEKITRLLGE